jgi:hypothetical protein
MVLKEGSWGVGRSSQLWGEMRLGWYVEVDEYLGVK